MKNQHLLLKNNIFVENQQQWCYFAHSNKYSIRAHDDNWNQNPSEIFRFSKNLDFWQILKIDFEYHICCHVYDLSNITNWQHIVGGPLWQHISNKCCFPTAPQFNFHLWCRFFSGFDKINNFWQQKQQVLFLSNMTPKVLLT